MRLPIFERLEKYLEGLGAHKDTVGGKELQDLERRVMAVVETGKAAVDNTESCHRCEGGGRLSADGRAHSHADYMSGKVATRNCDECGGAGRVFDEDAIKNLGEAIAALEEK